MVQTVREFITDAYRLISANSPTVPLHGDDLQKGIQFLNELLKYYGANGLLDTIDKEVTYSITAGTQDITFGQTGSGADVEQGYLSSVYSAWLTLNGTDYPLSHTNRAIFNESYKFSPLLGLPRFFIMEYRTDISNMRIYPGASQGYTLTVQGKFTPDELTSNDTMAGIPLYAIRFLRPAVAKDISLYKGRVEAWTDKHEQMLQQAEAEMIAATPINTKIYADSDTLLNGAARVRAGI
jgi:hypothetical protein